VGEVCPQPVEEVRQCGFRVHFDFGELWGAVTSPLLLFVLLKAAQSGHRHKKKFVAEVSSITPHNNTSGMSQVARGSDHGLSAISRDVWLAASSQTNFTKKEYQTLQDWHNANPILFFCCALPQLCDSVRPMVPYGVSTFQDSEWKKVSPGAANWHSAPGAQRRRADTFWHSMVGGSLIPFFKAQIH